MRPKKQLRAIEKLCWSWRSIPGWWETVEQDSHGKGAGGCWECMSLDFFLLFFVGFGDRVFFLV